MGKWKGQAYDCKKCQKDADFMISGGFYTAIQATTLFYVLFLCTIRSILFCVGNFVLL